LRPDCQQNMIARYARYGLLQPLVLEYRPWNAISKDFIVNLPVSNGCSSISVVVDRFPIMAQFIPLRHSAKKAPDLVRKFLRVLWRHLGMPSKTTLDRHTRLTSTIWKGIVDTLGIKSKRLSPFHPETNNQTERVNPTFDCYL
jgi:hypothetical protein